MLINSLTFLCAQYTVHHILLIGIGRAGQVDNVTAKLVLITPCSVPEWRPAPLAWCWVERGKKRLFWTDEGKREAALRTLANIA